MDQWVRWKTKKNVAGSEDRLVRSSENCGSPKSGPYGTYSWVPEASRMTCAPTSTREWTRPDNDAMLGQQEKGKEKRRGGEIIL